MNRGKTSSLIIRTPEGTVFSLLLAGTMSRFLACIIDIACVSAAASVVGTFLGLFSLLSLDLARALSVLAFFVLQIGYGIGCEWYWRGQTVGKRLLRLRVIDAQGLRIQFSQIVLRNLLRFVDMLPAFYLVGGVACLISRRAQRLGDLAANTIVIRTPQLADPDLDQLFSGKFNSLRAHPHLAARLRQRVSAHEASIAMQALLRRDQLETQARVELFRQLAEHFHAIVEFPPETTEGLSDEQYIRNVVDVLFRPRARQDEETVRIAKQNS